jgi:hypothetical protein
MPDLERVETKEINYPLTSALPIPHPLLESFPIEYGSRLPIRTPKL